MGWQVTLNNGIKIVFTTTNGRPWLGINLDNNNEKMKDSLKVDLEKRFTLEPKVSDWCLWAWTEYSKIISDAEFLNRLLVSASI